MLRERDLARARKSSAAAERDLGDRMMRRAKRPYACDPSLLAQKTRNTLDLRYLERLARSHRRENRGQAAREHRLPAAGRPDEEHVVAARSRDLECPLRTVLPANVGEIGADRGDGIVRPDVAHEPKLRAVTLRDGDRIVKNVDRVDVEALDEGGFGCVPPRHDDGLEARTARGDRHREHAARVSHGTIERQLSEHDESLDGERVDLFTD